MYKLFLNISFSSKSNIQIHTYTFVGSKVHTIFTNLSTFLSFKVTVLDAPHTASWCPRLIVYKTFNILTNYEIYDVEIQHIND